MRNVSRDLIPLLTSIEMGTTRNRDKKKEWERRLHRDETKWNAFVELIWGISTSSLCTTVTLSYLEQVMASKKTKKGNVTTACLLNLGEVECLVALDDNFIKSNGIWRGESYRLFLENWRNNRFNYLWIMMVALQTKVFQFDVAVYAPGDSPESDFPIAAVNIK